MCQLWVVNIKNYEKPEENLTLRVSGRPTPGHPRQWDHINEVKLDRFR